VIGIDDWARKRGLRYGTLICDLERGLPIEVLPDRKASTVSAWLQARPSIDIVSRDGSKEYAAANGRRKLPLSEQILAAFRLIL
jgi:transposase